MIKSLFSRFTRKAQETEPEDAQIWFDRGVELAEDGKHTEAVACFERAIEIRPGYADAWSGKGQALQNLGQDDQALACLDLAIKIQAAAIWFTLGEAFVEDNQLEEAIGHFEHAIEVYPDYAEAWYEKGQVRLKQGGIREALDCYEEAERLGDPRAAAAIETNSV